MFWFQLSKLIYCAGYLFNPHYQFDGRNQSLFDEEIRVGLEKNNWKHAMDEDDACVAINQVSVIVISVNITCVI